MAEQETPVEPKRRSKAGKIFLIFTLVNIVAALGIGSYLLFFENEASADGAEEEKKEKKEEKPGIGPLIEVFPIVANLQNPGSGRYVKVTIHLEAKDTSAKHMLEEAMVPIRDRLLIIFSGLSVEDTVGPELKQNIRMHIKSRVNDLFNGEPLKGVYFTEFVVQ